MITTMPDGTTEIHKLIIGRRHLRSIPG